MLLCLMISDFANLAEAVIGFSQRSYAIGEQLGPLGVTIGVLSGLLRIPIAVNFTTVDGTARGKRASVIKYPPFTVAVCSL